MMRQKLAFVVFGLPSLSLKRINGFSPVRMSSFGSAVLIEMFPPDALSVRQGTRSRHGHHRLYGKACRPGRTERAIQVDHVIGLRAPVPREPRIAGQHGLLRLVMA